MIDWDDRFRTAHLNSEGGRPSLCIQNVNPCPSARGSRNIYKEDEREILAAAGKYGYTMVSPPKAKVVSFVKLDGWAEG